MAADPLSEPVSRKKKPKNRKSQLRVVLDTNALYVTPTSLGSASDLVRDELVNLISESKYPDLEISWYLPEVVRHERQYQMQTEALKLRGAIIRIERLLGHNLALTDQTLLDHVRTKIDEKEAQLGLSEIKLDHSKVDWSKVIHAASYRIPPFQAGEKEKGFRDALVAESFLQLLEDSPRTPTVCRVVLVTEDQLLSQAVRERIETSPNASVLSSVEELKGLINTLVSNVSEDFIAHLKPKAQKLFFVSSEDKGTLYYERGLRERITEKFGAQLAQRPAGTIFRRNGTWYINSPNFSRKEGRRVFWASRIEVEVEAGTATKEKGPGTTSPSVGTTFGGPFHGGVTQPAGQIRLPGQSWDDYVSAWKTANVGGLANLSAFIGYGPSEQTIVTHKGRDIYEVLWSTEVTMSRELRKAAIEDLRHIDLKWEPVLPPG